MTDMKTTDRHEVQVHPADPDKVVVWDLDENGKRVGEPTACDNLDGFWDEYLPANVVPMHRPGIEVEVK